MDLERLEGTLARARPAGAAVAAWSLCVAEQTRFALGVRDGMVGGAYAPPEIAETASARYLLVWDDGRVSRGVFERGQLAQGLERSVAEARTASYDDPDAAQVLGPSEFPRVELEDPATAALARGEHLHRAGEWLEKAQELQRAQGFRLWSGALRATHERTRIRTSRGLDVTAQGTHYAWSASFDGEWGDGYQARALEPLPLLWERLERLARTAAQLKRPGEVPEGGRLPVLLHPHVVEELVLGTLLANLDGAAVAHGEAAFAREQFAKRARVLREDITLELDPLQPLRAGSYRFTAEGLPATRVRFIEGGRLCTPILDLKYARRLGLAPTPLPAEFDTLRLEVGETVPLEEARGQAAVVVLAVLGVHTLDPASGDFSLSAPQCLAPPGAEGAGRVRGTLAGNVFDLLRARELRAVAFPGETTPGLLVPCRFEPLP